MIQMVLGGFRGVSLGFKGFMVISVTFQMVFRNFSESNEIHKGISEPFQLVLEVSKAILWGLIWVSRDLRDL